MSFFLVKLSVWEVDFINRNRPAVPKWEHGIRISFFIVTVLVKINFNLISLLEGLGYKIESKLLGKNRFSIWKNSSEKWNFCNFWGTLKSREPKIDHEKFQKSEISILLQGH